MENFEKLKVKGSVERTNVTKVLNKLDTIPAEDIENKKTDELLEINEILCEREINLKNLDSQIENLISDSKEYEKEFSTSDKYKE